jgi:multiple sugar transport system substrate-binding protein
VNDVDVNVDQVTSDQLAPLAATEARTKRGHDVFGFLSPQAAYEDQVIDHGAVVSEIVGKVGLYGDLGKRSTYNPRTEKYFGVSDAYVPAPLIWRFDLWNAVGESPATWDHVRRAAPLLKAAAYPIGIGQSNELDSNMALIAFMLCFGSTIQDESGALTLDNKSAVEAVRFMVDLYQAGEDERIFGWNQASNNQLLLGGRGSMIVNAISAIRAGEDLQLPFANDLWLWPMPGGPAGRFGLVQYTSVCSIWKFSRNVDLAERFVADLCTSSAQATPASNLFNFPSFPGAYPVKQIYKAAAADMNRPRGKYSILTTVAAKYTRNVGYPGYANAAVDEVLNSHLIPQMFAQAAGEDDPGRVGSRDRTADETSLGALEGRGEDLVGLRGQRAGVRGSQLDPPGELALRPKVVRVDSQPPLHRAPAHLCDAGLGRGHKRVRLGRVGAHQHPALPARRDRHVAADKERQPTEHGSFGEPRLVADQVAYALCELLVVGHRVIVAARGRR